MRIEHLNFWLLLSLSLSVLHTFLRLNRLNWVPAMQSELISHRNLNIYNTFRLSFSRLFLTNACLSHCQFSTIFLLFAFLFHTLHAQFIYVLCPKCDHIKFLIILLKSTLLRIDHLALTWIINVIVFYLSLPLSLSALFLWHFGRWNFPFTFSLLKWC